VNERFVRGNIHAPDSPTTHFRSFLVGPLSEWAKTGSPEAVSVASRYSVLDVVGQSLTHCELKVSREHSHKTGPASPDADIGPFSITLGIVLAGRMRIELYDRQGDSNVATVLETGDFLAWRGSAYKHTWQCESEATVVTMRWREPV
jgi:hypothetical protein